MSLVWPDGRRTVGIGGAAPRLPKRPDDPNSYYDYDGDGRADARTNIAIPIAAAGVDPATRWERQPDGSYLPAGSPQSTARKPVRPHQPVYVGETLLPPPSPIASAPPAKKPAGNRVMDQTVSDLTAALAEMFPEIGVGERAMLAKQLADEYMRERGAAKAELRPKHPTAAPTEQMQFDEAYGAVSGQESKEDRMLKRLAQAQSGVPQVDPNIRREQAKVKQLRNSRDMALAAEKTKRRETGVSGPLINQENRKRTQDTEAVSQFNLYASGKWPKGKPAPFSAGRAESIPPPTGTPYRGPSQDEMYWKMVERGEDPALARSKVDSAFRSAPRP